MQNQIAIISPSSTLTKKIVNELKKQNLNIVVKQAFNENAINEVEELKLKGVKVLISRGNTAKILRNHFDIPIVDIKHTFFDCFNAYKTAKLYSNKIAFLATSQGFEIIINKSMEFLDGAKIISIDLLDENDVKIKLKEIANMGIEVAIGGLSLEKRIESLGIKYVMTEAELDSIKEAIEEASHLLKIENEREEKNLELKNKYEMINSIFNCVSEGIISIDQNGTIINLNNNAEELLGNHLKGKSINKIITADEIMDAIRSSRPVTGLIVNYHKNSLVVNIEPIKLADKIVGAVATLQRTNQIQAMDKKIRYTMLKKGHVADKTLDDIIGDSETIKSAKELAKKYAIVDSTVLILGETGTGKELFAKSIHNLSKRKKEPFVAINCASFSPNLLESEMFGYVKGAFTGALNEGKAGVFELAHGGTIFLDEISEASLDVQLKLLRVVQERKIVRIGDDNVIPIDVRIIAASNKNLKQQVQKRLFREDFYYRICVLELKIPPLRDRKDDISALIKNFIEKSSMHITGITNKALNMLIQEDWPGNIRQLSNVIERIMVTSNNETITSDIVRNLTDIKSETDIIQKEYEAANSSPFKITNKMHESKLFEDFTETELIKNALIETQGNRRLAAEKLGIGTTTLWRKMKSIESIDENFLRIVKYKTN